MDQVHQVAAVVDDDVRPGRDDPFELLFVNALRGVVDGEDVESPRGQGRRDVVLGRKGIAARDIHFGPARGEHLAKVGGFRLQMHRKRNFQARKRLFGRKLPLQGAEQRHVAPDPVDLFSAVRGEGDIFDFVHNRPPFA